MIPTAEKFYDKSKHDSILDIMIEFAQLHVTEALKQASKNATTIHDEKLLDEISKGLKSNDFIYKPSILNAYPLENIN